MLETGKKRGRFVSTQFAEWQMGLQHGWTDTKTKMTRVEPPTKRRRILGLSLFSGIAGLDKGPASHVD